MDFKVMATSYKGYKFNLMVIDEITIFMVAISIHQSRSEGTCDALIENILSKLYYV